MPKMNKELVGAGTSHCHGWTSYGEWQKSTSSLSKLTSATCAVASQCPVVGCSCKVKCSLQASPQSSALQDRLDFAWLCVWVWLPTPAQSKGRTDLKSSIGRLFGHGRVHGQVKVWAAALKMKMMPAGFFYWAPALCILYSSPILGWSPIFLIIVPLDQLQIKPCSQLWEAQMHGTMQDGLACSMVLPGVPCSSQTLFAMQVNCKGGDCVRQGRYTSMSAFSFLIAGFSMKDKIVAWLLVLRVCSFPLVTLRCGSQARVCRCYTDSYEGEHPCQALGLDTI